MFFGGNHEFVYSEKELVDIDDGLGAAGEQPAADGKLQFRVFFERNQAHGLANGFDLRVSFYFGTCVDKVDKLFAAVTGDDFARRFVFAFLNELADGANDGVAKAVSVLAVNLFKIVHVEHGDKVVIAVFPDGFV